MNQRKLILIISVVLLLGSASCISLKPAIYSRPYLCDAEKGEWVKSASVGPESFHIRSLSITVFDNKIIASGSVLDIGKQKVLPGVYIFLLQGDTCRCKLTGPVGRTDYTGRFHIKLAKEYCFRLLLYYPGMVSQEIRILNCH